MSRLLRSAFLIACCLAAVAAQQLPKREAATTGRRDVVLGSVEPDHRYPWVVEVNNRACHGTLISRRWVLTAAHCVDLVQSGVPVHYSRIAPDGTVSSGLRFEDTRTYVHPDYDPGFLWSEAKHDIALLYLGTPLDSDHTSGTDPLLRPAELAAAPVIAGQSGVVASTRHHTSPDPLPPGTVAVLATTVTGFSPQAMVTNSAAGSFCPGDSGSGLITTPFVCCVRDRASSRDDLDAATVMEQRAASAIDISTLFSKKFVSGVASSVDGASDCSTANFWAKFTPVFEHLDWIGEVTRLVGRIEGAGDFNGDGHSDLLWRNAKGTVAIWFMNAGHIESQTYVSVAPGNDWQIAGTGDFNIDGRTDILWRNTNGAVAIWFMKGSVIEAQSILSVVPGNDWQIRGIGDFNRDKRSDILWRNANGAVAIWFMRGGLIEAQGYPSVVPGNDWQIQGVGDFNMDDRADILWRNTDGTVAIWFMRGAVIDVQGYPAVTPGNEWRIQGVGDFNQDRRSDILWRNVNGTAAIWLMKGAVIDAQAFPSIVPANDWQIEAAYDFNADGRSDIVWRDGNKTITIWFMRGGLIQSYVVPFSP